MVARYILFRLKTVNSRHFKCVSHPLLFYITVTTTDNVKYFGYVIVSLYRKYNFMSFIKVLSTFHLEIFV